MAKKNNGKRSLDRWQVPVGGKGFALKDCDPGAKPYGSFSHADDQHRAGQVGGNLGGQRIKAFGHQRRAGRDMTAQHAGDE